MFKAENCFYILVCIALMKVEVSVYKIKLVFINITYFHFCLIVNQTTCLVDFVVVKDDFKLSVEDSRGESA